MNDSILKDFKDKLSLKQITSFGPYNTARVVLFDLFASQCFKTKILRSSGLNSTHTLQQKLENTEKICFALALQIKETLHIPIAQLECKLGNKMR